MSATVPEVPSAPASARAESTYRRLAPHLPLIAFGVLIVAVGIGIALTPSFVTADNFKSILQSAALVGIVAVCMTPMAMSGNFVSLATQQSTVCGSMAFIYLVGTGMNVALAIVLTLILLALIGALQGAMVALGLNPVVTTLAAGVITLGVINTINGAGGSVSVGEHHIGWGDNTVIGIPIQVIAFLIVAVIVSIVMAKSAAGRKTALAGAGAATARLSGISIAGVTLGVFILASVGMAIAGILGGAQFNESTPSDFSTITIDAVAAILVGGTSIAGGSGAPWRSAVGAVLIAAIEGLMTLNGWSFGVRQAIQGAIVIAVVVLLQIVRRRRGSS